jgi:hypothetical protein
MRRFLAATTMAVAMFAFPGADQRADGQGKDPETIELHLLDKNAGAAFGDWNVWRYDEGDKALFLINAKTGYAVYLPWTSNGWINYRTDKGNWYVLLSKGEAKEQDRKDLKIEQFLKKTPAAALETGKYNFQAFTVENGKKETQQWTVKVTKTHIDFHNARFDDRLTIRKNSGEITHNGRTIGD